MEFMQQELNIFYIGVSFKTASVEVREKVALSVEEQKKCIRELSAHFDLEGCLILSTCNRSEFYISGEKVTHQLDQIREWLNAFKKVTVFTDNALTLILSGRDVVTHFFKVVSSLESQVIGEPQITGQVKDGYNLAHDLCATDTMLNKLFSFGLQAQKRVKNNTFLTDGAVSVSFAGVELASKIFDQIKDKHVLLVGAGETAELAATHFQKKGVSQFSVVNRTLSKSEELAGQFGGKGQGLDALETELELCDIVISATSSSQYVITNDNLRHVIKRRERRPMILIDLAIPRDIDPAVDHFDGIYLFNLDDLQEVVEANLEKRKKEIPRALRIIEEEVEAFISWASTHSIASIINRLTTHFETIRLNELKRLKSRLPVEGYEEIDYLTKSLINKFLFQHITALKKSKCDPDRYQQCVEVVYSLYNLED